MPQHQQPPSDKAWLKYKSTGKVVRHKDGVPVQFTIPSKLYKYLKNRRYTLDDYIVMIPKDWRPEDYGSIAALVRGQTATF